MFFQRLIFFLFLLVSVNVRAQNYFPVRVNNLWGLIDQYGNKVTCISWFSPPYAYNTHRFEVVDTTGLVPYLSDGCRKIREITRDSIPYSEKDGPGLIAGKGYYDKFRHKLPHDTFALREPFYEGLARVSSNREENFMLNQIGFIDRTGKIVIPCVFDYRDIEDYFVNGAIRFDDNTRDYREPQTGYMNRQGDTIVAPIYGHESHDFCEDLAAVEKKGKWNFVTRKGVLISSQWFAGVDDFSEGMALVTDSLKNIYYIDKTGKKQFALDTVYFKSEYYYHGSFHEGMACVRTRDNRFGYVNHQGQIMIPIKYDRAEDFSEGFALVHDSTGYFFIDKMGKPLSALRFDDADGFEHGLARVYAGKDVGNLATGCVVGDSQWRFFEGKIYSRDLSMGYINRQGKLVWKPTR